jgi:hypothetical protein
VACAWRREEWNMEGREMNEQEIHKHIDDRR